MKTYIVELSVQLRSGTINQTKEIYCDDREDDEYCILQAKKIAVNTTQLNVDVESIEVISVTRKELPK